jgi:hypothetical protein
MTLRNAVIKLAHAKPELRDFLLPLFKQAREPSTKTQRERLWLAELLGEWDYSAKAARKALKDIEPKGEDDESVSESEGAWNVLYKLSADFPIEHDDSLLLPKEAGMVREIQGHMEAMCEDPGECEAAMSDVMKLLGELEDSFRSAKHPNEVYDMREDAVRVIDGLIKATASAFTPNTLKGGLQDINRDGLHKAEQDALSNITSAANRANRKRGDEALDAWNQAREELVLLRQMIVGNPTLPKPKGKHQPGTKAPTKKPKPRVKTKPILRRRRQAALHAALVRLAHAHPEFQDWLMPLVVAPTVVFGKQAADQRPRPYAQDTIVEDLHQELYKLSEDNRLGNGRAPDGAGALEYQIRFLRASSHRALPWVYDHIVRTAEVSMKQSPVLAPVAKKVIAEAKKRAKEWSVRHEAEQGKRTHA